MKTIITTILLILSLSAIGQSITVSTNGSTVITESVLFKNFEQAQMGLTVLSGQETSIGYRVGTSLLFNRVSPNAYITNTMDFKGNVFAAPSVSVGVKVFKLFIFTEYKYVYKITGGSGDSFIGFGIRL